MWGGSKEKCYRACSLLWWCTLSDACLDFREPSWGFWAPLIGFLVELCRHNHCRRKLVIAIKKNYLVRRGSERHPFGMEVRWKKRAKKIKHLVCLIMKAIFSVVQCAAEMIRSPSFSRFSSSITTRSSPAAKASRASSMESKEKVSLTGAFRTSVGFHCGGEIPLVRVRGMPLETVKDLVVGFLVIVKVATGAIGLGLVLC